ncbi:MAG TPA: hypothetical protein PL041_09975 [Melioribacteraceae bacterium]|nr:hypothetical protein [Melioribacteraceae bacterium]
MKVFLDDIRTAPAGWKRTKTADETIELLLNNEVEELSLDYDLGGEIYCGNGFDVLFWIENNKTNPKFTMPKRIYIHSTHSIYRPRMEAFVKQLLK